MWSILMLMITRVADKERSTLIVSGRIDAEQLPDLRRFVQAEQENKLTIDLAEVSLVDAAVIRFLLVCEERGIRLVRCPAYVREWMVREKRSE
jgi:anti-anti-sigma regulatory factor